MTVALTPQNVFSSLVGCRLECQVECSSIGQLKEELARQWGGTDGNLHDTLYGESRLSDWLQDEDQLFDMPPSDMATPIIPLPARLAVADGDSVPELSMSRIVSGEAGFQMLEFYAGEDKCLEVLLVFALHAY